MFLLGTLLVVIITTGAGDHLLVDAGDPTGCTDGTTTLSYDQRGSAYSRTQDGDGDGVATCDIGATEL